MRAEVEWYARRASPVHGWDARWKLVAAAICLAALAGLRTPVVAAAAGGLAAGGLLLARLPVRLVLGRLAAAQIFLLPCLMFLPFSMGGETVAVGPLKPARAGLELTGVLYLRALALITVGLAVVYSTPMVTLLRGLQALHWPRLLVEITLLTYRYLFTLWWELTRMRWALAARGFRARGRVQNHRTLAQVVGVTLVRSVERTGRIQQALRCRGFDGRLRLRQPWRSSIADRLKTLAVGAGAVALWLWDRLLAGG